jgi:hypothetical protein
MWVYLYPDNTETGLKNAYIWIPNPTSIVLDKISISLTTIWQTEQLTATIEPTVSDKTITWSSNDTTIATVSTTGLVTCVTPWTCTITATTVNGLTASCGVSGNPGWSNLDISTATLSKQFATWYGFQWLYINPSEDVALTASYGNPWTIRGYTYSNADISTATLEWTKKPNNKIHCVYANASWTHIYYWTHADGYVYEYSTTNWSVANMTSYKSKYFWTACQCVWVDTTEKYLVIWWTWSNGYGINLYEMSTPWDITTATLVTTYNMSYNVHGVVFNDTLDKCVTCEYSASSGTVHQYNWDILNSGTPTQTHTFWPVRFTIGYANITADGTKMYAARENGYIYEYTLS